LTLWISLRENQVASLAMATAAVPA